MPATISKKDGKYQVRTPGGVKAKGTTKAKAEAQRRLLAAIDHDPSFKPRASVHKKPTRAGTRKGGKK